MQSGKTSHMFGLMCAAADEGFSNFILLTTDNILFQQQTFLRAQKDLSDFCICGENDYLEFVSNNMRKPAVIVLKKNSRILRQWKNNLSSTDFVSGNPLFIVDDEVDAARLNTMVNRNRQSTINKNLGAIKRIASSSIYIEVTGTPPVYSLANCPQRMEVFVCLLFQTWKRIPRRKLLFPRGAAKADNSDGQ